MTDEKDKKAEADKAEVPSDSEGKKEDPSSQGEVRKNEGKDEAPVVEEVKEEAIPEAVVEVEVPKEFKKIVEDIEKMTVMELNSLVKVFEEKFGVSATAVAAGPAAGGDEGGGEEKTEFDVELTSMGEKKIAVIKAVKEVLGLGLKEAKDLVEAAPTSLKTGMKKEDAEALKAKIEEAGGQVELK